MTSSSFASHPTVSIYSARHADEAEQSFFRPRLLVALKKIITGVIDVPPVSLDTLPACPALSPAIELAGRTIYVGHYNDPIDIMVADTLNHNPRLLTLGKSIRRIDRGQYNIDGFDCVIFLAAHARTKKPENEDKTPQSVLQVRGDEANSSLVPMVDEGGAQQPLVDYMLGTLDNITWEELPVSCALDMVEDRLLPPLHKTHVPWEARVDRRKAMELACHRAAVREQVAAVLLRAQGIEVPSPVHYKHVQPVIIKSSPHGPLMRVTYAWKEDYSEVELAVLNIVSSSTEKLSSQVERHFFTGSHIT